ncbi:MAG: DNA polymerase III subunit delta' [Candidatus Omnitrophota bacterium]
MLFEDIKGQDSVLDILKKSIEKGRIFSSYLFVGPDGVGKSLTAGVFAKAINCLERNGVDPCGNCSPCKKIDLKIHPDVLFIEPKANSSSIAIDEIRKMLIQTNFKPYEAKMKVFIIENTHSMNAEAANAFLKTLEEPPESTVFILIARSKEMLLPTIVSRCHVVEFLSAPRDLVHEVIRNKFSITDDEALVLSNFASGSIGKAVRMKNQNAIVRKNRIIDSFFSGGIDFQDELSLYSGKMELKENLEFLLSLLRDMFLCNLKEPKDAFFNIDKIEKIKQYAGRFSSERLDFIIKKVIMLLSYVDYNVNPKMIIDSLTLEVV